MPSQGFVGQTAEGQVALQDANPHSEGATFEAATFESEDPGVAAVAAHPDDPLRCNVLLVGAGATRVLCHVDPGQGETLEFAVEVEAALPAPGEAVGGTFELGEFTEQPPA